MWQIHSFLRIWSHLLQKSLMENCIFCAVCTEDIFSRWNASYYPFVLKRHGRALGTENSGFMKYFVSYWMENKVCWIACHACLRATCQRANVRGLRANVLACYRGLRFNVLACQYGLRAKVPKAWQLFIFTCKHANKRAKVPYGVPMFQLSVPTCETY